MKQLKFTPVRLLTIDEHQSKIARNSVFDCHLLPDWRQMAKENTVLMLFDLLSSIVLTFQLPAFRCQITHLIYHGKQS